MFGNALIQRTYPWLDTPRGTTTFLTTWRRQHIAQLAKLCAWEMPSRLFLDKLSPARRVEGKTALHRPLLLERHADGNRHNPMTPLVLAGPLRQAHAGHTIFLHPQARTAEKKVADLLVPRLEPLRQRRPSVLTALSPASRDRRAA